MTHGPAGRVVVADGPDLFVLRANGLSVESGPHRALDEQPTLLDIRADESSVVIAAAYRTTAAVWQLDRSDRAVLLHMDGTETIRCIGVTDVDGNAKVTAVRFDQGGCLVWDASTGAPSDSAVDLAPEIVFGGVVGHFPTADLMATFGDSDKIRTWDLGTGENLASILLPFDMGDVDAVSIELFNSEPAVVAAVSPPLSGRSEVFVWAAQSGTKMAHLNPELGRISSLTFASSGRQRVLAASVDDHVYLLSSEGGIVERTQLDTGAERLVWLGRGGLLSSTDDGPRLLSGDQPPAPLTIAHVEAPADDHTTAEPPRTRTLVEPVTSDGRSGFVIAAARSIELLDASGAPLADPISLPGGTITAISSSTLLGEPCVVVGTDEGVVSCYEVATSTVRWRANVPDTSPVVALGTGLLQASETAIAVAASGAVVALALADGSLSGRLRTEQSTVAVASVGSHKSHTCVALVADGVLECWDVERSRLRWSERLSLAGGSPSLKVGRWGGEVAIVGTFRRGPREWVLRGWSARSGDSLFDDVSFDSLAEPSVTIGALRQMRAVVVGHGSQVDFWQRDATRVESKRVGGEVESITRVAPERIVVGTREGFEMVEGEYRAPASRRTGLGVCLSGGGHRAALFGLGSLLYLVDSGMNQEVSCITSASGGSMLNAHIAASCTFAKETDSGPESGFDTTAAAFALRVTRRHTFSTNWALAITVLTLAVAVCVAAGLGIAAPLPVRVLALPIWSAAYLLRGHVVEARLNSGFYRRGHHSLRLADVSQRGTEHVIAATDLAGNELFLFTTAAGGFAYTSDRGWGRADSLPVATAVRASSAFPGGFPPRRLQLRGRRARVRFASTEGPGAAYLSDGGVWNNLATDWVEPGRWIRRAGDAGRYRQAGMSGKPPARRDAPKHIVVVNASYRKPPTAGRGWQVPIIAEASVLGRAMSLMFDNTVVPRIESLRDATRRAWLSQASAQDVDSTTRADTARFDSLAAVVSIDEEFSNADILRRLRLGSGSPQTPTAVLEVRNRATEVLDRQRAEIRSLPWLQGLAAASRRVPTTLSRLSSPAAAGLILHGYLATRNECRVALGSRWTPALSLERLANLVGCEETVLHKELQELVSSDA